MLGSYTSPSFTSTLLKRTTPPSLGKGFWVSPAEKDTRDGTGTPRQGEEHRQSGPEPRPTCCPQGQPPPLFQPQSRHTPSHPVPRHPQQRHRKLLGVHVHETVQDTAEMGPLRMCVLQVCRSGGG